MLGGKEMLSIERSGDLSLDLKSEDLDWSPHSLALTLRDTLSKPELQVEIMPILPVS